MTELVANFSLKETNIDALFEIKAAGTTWGSIVGDLANQTDLQAALNAKQDIIADLEAIRTGAQNGDFSYSTMLTYGDIVTYNAAAFATAAQGALAETALQKITSGDVTTALGYTPYNSSNPKGYITAKDLNGYVLSSDLATVATSGDYNDLSNKPIIPTVNNATLTIQKNGTDVQTFTANASSNVTCNITVPTDNNQLANGAGYVTATDVANMIASIPQFEVKIVDILPPEGQKMVLYLVPKTSSSGDDIYDEYIWLENTQSFELVGTTTVDLSDYYTKGEITNLLNEKQDNLDIILIEGADW